MVGGVTLTTVTAFPLQFNDSFFFFIHHPNPQWPLTSVTRTDSSTQQGTTEGANVADNEGLTTHSIDFLLSGQTPHTIYTVQVISTSSPDAKVGYVTAPEVVTVSSIKAPAFRDNRDDSSDPYIVSVNSIIAIDAVRGAGVGAE